MMNIGLKLQNDLGDIACLESIRNRNINRIVIAHLNINSLRNKFESLVDQIVGKVDILMISKTKLDSSFPEGQFLIKGYNAPYIMDRNSHGGGIMLYVREDITSKLLNCEKEIEGFYVELSTRKTKWLLSCSYNPNKNNINKHLEILSTNLALYSSKYENIIVIGDFNVGVDNSSMQTFCDTYDLASLIKNPTCFKNPESPTCIDLILTTKPRSFQHSCVVETGLSDFHRMIVTVIKSTFQKLMPRIIHYRNYKNFQNDKFREDLISKLSTSVLNENDEGFSMFFDLARGILDEHAPCKQKYARGNHMPFFVKNKFLKHRTGENKRSYSKQRNYCVSLLRKTKKEYYSNLDEKNVTDNRKFWKTVKPFLQTKLFRLKK